MIKNSRNKIIRSQVDVFDFSCFGAVFPVENSGKYKGAREG